MPTTALFQTLVYRAPLADAALVAELERSVRQLAADDAAGRRWSRAHGYAGYTSYASLDDLPLRDPAFGACKRQLDRHVAAFAGEAGFDLPRRLRLDSLWVNLLRPGGHHAAHLHPHSAVSGTLYVALPPGSGGLKLEDPRLSRMMAAPLRRQGLHHLLVPEIGEVVLWESWLRHEVVANAGRGAMTGDRISISFNYR